MNEKQQAGANQMRRILKLAVIPFLCLLCFGFGYVLGHIRGTELEVLAEVKITSSNLERVMEGNEPDPRFREYIKARYYFLASRLSDKYFDVARWDAGPINEQSVTNIPIGKEAFVSNGEYEIFKRRKESLKH